MTVPSEIDALHKKHIQVVRYHNLAVLLLAGVVYSGLFFLLRAGAVSIVIWCVCCVMFLAFGASVLDDLFARWLGFVCPRCGASLYVPQSIYWAKTPIEVTGRCPKCNAELT